eukprot:566212-Alexandrium_andersonii.AAC.1
MTRFALRKWAEGMLFHLHVVAGSEHADLRLSFGEEPGAARLHAAKDAKAGLCTASLLRARWVSG